MKRNICDSLLEGGVLIDIDGTLTDDRDEPQIAPHHPLGNALFRIFLDEMGKAGRRETAADLAAYTEKKVYWDYPDFIAHFALDPERIWSRLRTWHAEHLKTYEDGVRMVKTLYDRGCPLFIVSNNPLSGCLLKLEVAGLGTLEGSPWFRGIMCSNLHCGQKGQQAFWRRALEESGLAPAAVSIVGNDMHDDYLVPYEAGVRSFYIVDRGGVQPPPMKDDGLTLVRDLTEVIPLIESRRGRKVEEAI